MTIPARGDIWRVDFGSPIGREQGYRRPAVVVSSDGLNNSPAGVVMVVPMTTSDRGLASQIRIEPPEGGLKHTSFAKCEDLRPVSLDRLESRVGQVLPASLTQIERALRFLLDLP